MKNIVEGVIWDWDGTVTSDLACLAWGVKENFWDIMESLERGHGFGNKFSQIEAEVRRGICKAFKKDPGNFLHVGARRLIGDLGEEGIPQAVGTDNLESDVRQMIGAAGFDEYLDIVVARDLMGRGERKPHPKTMLMCAEKMGVPKDRYNRIVVIGNTNGDMESARRAGIEVRVAVETGFYGFSANLWNATVVYPDLGFVDVDLLNELVEKSLTRSSHWGIDSL